MSGCFPGAHNFHVTPATLLEDGPFNISASAVAESNEL